MWHIFVLLLQTLAASSSAHKCNPIYVRWPRVKVVFGARSEGPYSLTACRSACTTEEDPVRSGIEMQCSGFNQREGPNDRTHHCQLYQADQLQHVDGFVEADDRYSFYWKYCVHSPKTCSGDYAFTFLSDRYMDAREVTRVAYTSSLEDCLSACLDESNFACRSVSFNRTDGGCHLSQQNQLSKPAFLRMNNNPNFRIDYYESNCFNNSFAFEYECKEEGILVKVDSKYPYTGALYGLYDFFTCRVEPKEAKRIEYLFPSPTMSKNCSDSIRYKGNDMVLEVVLSTDGIEPLYFITPDDLTYQARCPIREGKYLNPNIDLLPNIESKIVDISKFTASARALFSMLSNATLYDKHEVHSTAVHFNDPKNSSHSEATNNLVVGLPQRKQSSSTKKDSISLTFPPATTTAISTSTLMLQTTPPQFEPLSMTSADGESSTLSTSMNTEDTAPTNDTISPKPGEVTLALSTSTLNLEESLEKPESSAMVLTFGTNLSSASTTTSLLPDGIADESLAGIYSSNASSNASDASEEESLMKDVESNRMNEEPAVSSSSTDTDTTYEGLSATSIVLSNTTTIASSSTTATSVRSAPSSRFPESASSDEMNEFTTHISFPGVLSSRFVPSVTPSSTTKDTFILPFVPTTRSSSTISSITTLEQTSSTSPQEILATLTSTYAVTTNAPTSQGFEDMSTRTTNTVTTQESTTTASSTASPSPATARPPTTSTAAPTSTSASSPSTTASTTTTTASTNTSSTTSTTTAEPITSTMASTTTTTTTTTQTTPMSAITEEKSTLSTTKASKESVTSGVPMSGARHKRPKEAVMFDIFHNGQPAEAVVVGSRITLSFTPFYAIPPNYMSISGCQVEPIGSLYEWEREPLAIIKDGCQADHVGLVCPPQRTDFGISVTVESFRYQTTAQVQYTCLVRICPFAPCPAVTCPNVEGCSTNDPISRTFGLRAKRHLTIEEIRAALAANPDLQRQIRLTNYLGTSGHSSAETQQQLIALGGDHIVKKRLVVVNSQDQLRYYVRTGDVPNGR